MSFVLYLIAGPATLRDAANQAATAWDTVGGHFSFLPPMLYVIGQDSAIATHTAIHLRVEDAVAPQIAAVIAAVIAANFPNWQMIEGDDPKAALTQAGLAVVLQAIS